jgi:hypothetical protein
MSVIARIRLKSELTITAATDYPLSTKERMLVVLEVEQSINSLPPIVTNFGTVGLRIHIKGEK